MGKVINILFFCLLVESLLAQNIGIFSGINSFTDLSSRDNNPHHYTNYSGGIGYSLGLEFDDLKIYDNPVKFTSRFNKYEGDVSHRTGGLGGGYRLNAHLKSYCLSFAFHFIKNNPDYPIQVSLGFEYTLLLQEKINGTSNHWGMSYGSTTSKIDENTIEINNKDNFGLIGTVGIKRKLGKSYYIEPQFSMILGLTPELQLDSPNVFKILFELGISKSMKIALPESK